MGYVATVALLIGSCSSKPVPVARGCIPAAEPADAVVQVTRTTLPIGSPRTEERGAVTHGGTCPPNIVCKQVDSVTMSTIWAELSRAATVDHGPPSSPHYGGRWLDASWKGGSCEIADSQETPVTSAGEAQFDAAYEAAALTFTP